MSRNTNLPRPEEFRQPHQTPVRKIQAVRCADDQARSTSLKTLVAACLESASQVAAARYPETGARLTLLLRGIARLERVIGLTILFDVECDRTVALPLRKALEELDVSVDTWDGHRSATQGAADILLIEPARLATALGSVRKSKPQMTVAVLAEDLPVAEIRQLLRQGVGAVVDVTEDSEASAQAVIAAAIGHLVLPAGCGLALATRLDEPPRPLDANERRFLTLSATRSIEAAGQVMGLSRRQSQRHFSALCASLSLPSRLHSIVAAGRWGLAHHYGTGSTNLDVEGPVRIDDCG